MNATEGDAGLHWARIAKRRLRLSDEAVIVRQSHRNRLWYVVRDRLGDRYYRFAPNVYHLLSLLDGYRTVEEAYDLVRERLGDEAPGQLEILKLLWRLHSSDLLRGDVAGRTEDLVERAQTLETRKRLMQLRSPLAIRIPLVDPANMLARLTWLGRLLFSLPAFMVWIAVLVIGLSNVVLNWQEMTTNFTDRVLSYDNLLLMWFVFPVVKLLHELGHGLALRRWGQNSHELGIMFLVFMPVPYIDASSSALMTRPTQRMIVGAGGLYVELFIASLAMILWAHLEPGLARAVAFNVILVAGASALLFNGNPLLKFDAYYVLSDALQMPNLGQRSNQYWIGGVQSHLLGMDEVEDPIEAQGEAKWLFLYAPASLAYRLFLMVTIAIFVAKQVFFLGTALAILAIFNMLIWPILKGVAFLFRNPRLKSIRGRALYRSAGVTAAAAAVVFIMPLPHRTMVEGVVWYSEGSEIRPKAGGYATMFAASSGDRIRKDETIVQLSDPETEAELLGLEARLEALRAQYQRELTSDRGQARLTAEEMQYIRERAGATRARLDALRTKSAQTGQLVIPRQSDFENGWVGRGLPIGHVVGDGPMKVVTALPQADMELISERLVGVSVRFASAPQRVHAAELLQISPQATDALPAPLFSTEGGGRFSMRQTAPGETGARAIEKFFEADISLSEGSKPLFGERAYVMFDHGSAPLSKQIARGLRQLFLREFEV